MIMIGRYAYLALLVAVAVADSKGYRQTSGRSATVSELPRYTNSWAVEVSGGAEAADAIATKYKLENRGQVGNLKNIYHFKMAKETFDKERKRRGISEYRPLETMTASLNQEEQVGLVEQQASRKMVLRSYFSPNDVRWPDQWSLRNIGQSTDLTDDDFGHDLKVVAAWIQGYTGHYTVVGVVDDGVGYTHPDLKSNYDVTIQYDYLDNDKDPFPEGDFGDCEDDHGTCCAGAIAMAKNNKQCGVGVAHLATITGIRLIGSDGQTDMQTASSLGHRNDIIDIYSNSWGPDDDGIAIEKPGTLTQMAFKQGVTMGRDGKGSIFVWASGNGGEEGDSCAADGFTSSIYTIGIGAAASDGTQASYDEQCSGKMAVAFVNNPFNDLDIGVVATTADGGCNDEFDGTSAACPLVSGVMALVLEANPSLTWRDVQYLVAYTSNPDLLVGGEWAANSAGLRFSHKFGFGAIDAEAMVTRAKHWINVPEQQSDTVVSTPASLMTAGSTTIQFTFSYDGDIRFMEHVVVIFSLNFDISDELYESFYRYFYEVITYRTIDYDVTAGRGDIQMELVSPSGTQSVIFPYRRRDGFPGALTDFPLMSVHFWGEDPSGTWTLRIHAPLTFDYPVTVSGVSMTVYGTGKAPAAVARIPASCDPVCARGCAASGPQYCDACADEYVRHPTTLKCIYKCPSDYELEFRSRYCFKPGLPLSGNLSDGANLGTRISFVLLLLAAWVGIIEL